MPDLEKVIKGLECAVVGITSNEECSKCAYQPYRFGRCKWDVMADALELLKEQEPLKPVLKQFKLGFHTDAVRIEPCCGGCGRKLETWYKYCSYCGRAVKWDEPPKEE